MNKIGEIKNKNILFLQGPMGPFFKKLDTKFQEEGAKTYKIGFNMGDSFFSNRKNYVPYRGTENEWEGFIYKFLQEKNIDKIFLFGDCRFYQSVAIKVAYGLNIDVFVFEEGYIRPDYITMERFGVNDHSHISRDADFYKNLEDVELPDPEPAQQSKFSMVMSAIIYYLLSNLFHFKYPYYRHHRDFSAIREAFFGVRGLVRKLIYPYFEQGYLEEMEHRLSKKYFFVPLQTHNDFQVLKHSGYGSIEKFIIEVLDSFAKHAPEQTWLVFKHHPVDRGRKNYKTFILEQAAALGVEKKVLVVHDTYLPTCLKHAIGTITINSTVGLSSIYHKTPTITLGNAIYDIEGLTCKGMKLADFWHTQITPDAELFNKFRNYLISTTQLNGSFYGKMPKLK